MKSPLKHISDWFLALARVFRREFAIVISDAGALLFFIGLPLAYPIVYTLIYNPEVVNKVAVAVVDDSRTPRSRQLVRQASATPQVEIYDYAPNLADAKAMMASHDVYAILHIPADFDKKINRGEQAQATLFCDMSLLLRYRSLLSAMTSLQLKLAQDITVERVSIAGASSMASSSMPVNSESHFLGDTQQGFASFVIPGIVVLILQQSMILGVALLGATARERRRRNGGVDPREIAGAPVSAQIWGKSLCFVTLYAPLTLYILHIVPEMFNLPHYGSPADYLLFIFPLLLSSAFLGQTTVILCREREYTFLVVVFTSVIFLFLSGLTWPRYAMSPLWTWIGNLVPATWGVEGFIRINSNAATLAESARPYTALWILTAAYCVTAYMVTRHLVKSGK